MAPFVPKRKEMEADGEEEVEQGDQDGGGEAAEEVADEAGLEDEGGGEADGQGLGEVREVKRKKEKKERRMKKRKKWDGKIEDVEVMNALRDPPGNLHTAGWVPQQELLGPAQILSGDSTE